MGGTGFELHVTIVSPSWRESAASARVRNPGVPLPAYGLTCRTGAQKH